MALLAINIEDCEGRPFESPPGAINTILFQFSWRGLLNLLRRNRILTIQIEHIEVIPAQGAIVLVKVPQNDQRTTLSA